MKHAMKYLGMIAGGMMLLALSGCSATMYSSSSRVTDDLYGTHDKNSIAQLEVAERAQARKAAEAAILADAKAEGEYFKSTGNPYQDVLADTYDDAYARRLRGFNSPTYRMPSSYYNFRFSDASNYTSAYDPAFYNVMVMGDEVWVEPKYITSMFGSWGSPSINVNFGWSSPYWGGYYGWNDPWFWGSSYWGRPYWGGYWGDRWGWNYPYYGWGGHYYPHWGGHHHPNWGGGWYPGSSSRPNVSYRPNYRPYGNSTTGGNRYGNSSGYRPSGTTYGGSSGSSSGYRNRYDKDNSSSGSSYRPSSNTGSSSSSGSYRPSSSGSSSSGSSSSGGSSSGGGSYGGGSKSSGGSRGR